MMKIIVFFLMALATLCSAQTIKKLDENVDLPVFDLRGIETIEIDKSKKMSPDFGSTISDDFLKPSFPAESLELRNFINPIKDNISLIDSISHLNGKFNAGVGIYVFPTADILFTNPFNGGTFEWFAYANNQMEYVRNSGKSDIGAGLNLSLFNNNNGSFLPGAEIKFHGNYDLSSYRLYGSMNSSVKKRILNGGNVSIDMNNFMNDYFTFAVSLENDFNSFKDENYSDNFVKINAYGKLALSGFNLACDVTLKKQFLHGTNNEQLRNGYLGISPRIGLNISELFKVNFGINYSQYYDNVYFTPFASVAVKMDNSISLFGEFNPHAELVNSKFFIKSNPYVNPASLEGAYIRYDNALKIAVKYEYDKYFQLNGGIKMLSSSELPYYANSNLSGQFDVVYDDARIFTAFADMLFYGGPLGYLYGDVELSLSNDTAGYSIPYQPAVKSSIYYGYSFSKIKTDAEVNINYYSAVYTDLPNKKKLSDNINLGMKMVYHYKPRFLFTVEFSNLLLKDNYKWANYKEMPFNINGGVTLLW
jgi:hypothetical protein